MTLAQARRAKWEATHDPYGRDAEELRITWELYAEEHERRMQTIQARIDAYKAGHPEWLTPMMIDEMPRPDRKRELYDYGRDPETSEYAQLF